MYCLRCGRETTEDHVFCDECRKYMEQYPVRPGTAVLLPKRKEVPAVKKAKRHGPPAPKEQIQKLKKQRTALLAVLIVLCLILLAAAASIVFLIRNENVQPGQNYSAVTQATETTP